MLISLKNVILINFNWIENVRYIINCKYFHKIVFQLFILTLAQCQIKANHLILEITFCVYSITMFLTQYKMEFHSNLWKKCKWCTDCMKRVSPAGVVSVNSASSQYPTGWMYGLLASHLRTNTIHLLPFTQSWAMPRILLSHIFTNNHMNHPSCQSEWGVGCRQQQQWLQHRWVMGSSCQRLPASSRHGILMAWPTKYGREHSMIFRTETNTENCVHIKWHTVLRLLKRCLGASWPLQFFTYVFQLNSPSLQPVSKHTNITKTAYATHFTVFFLNKLNILATFFHSTVLRFHSFSL